MAKKQKSSKKRSKPAKPAKAKARSGPSNVGSSNAGKKDRELPKPRVTATKARGFDALMRSLVREMRVLAQGQQTLNQRLEQDRQERQQQAATPAPPSPHDDAFAALPESIAETAERTCRIEACVQQPPRDPRLDVPLSVVQQRVMFAGACKTLGITQPTPAIIGRVMHDNIIFTPNDDKAPRRLLQLIYAKRNIPDHLSPEIRSLLERYGNETPQPSASSAENATSPDQQQLPKKKPGRRSAKIAKKLGPEFDLRFDLIVNTGCGRKDPVQNGERTNYRRHLTPSGRELFNGWPNWSDATGGIGLADEQTELPTSQPDRADADGGATQPAT